jgi:hypothetical protein
MDATQAAIRASRAKRRTLFEWVSDLIDRLLY